MTVQDRVCRCPDSTVPLIGDKNFIIISLGNNANVSLMNLLCTETWGKFLLFAWQLQNKIKHKILTTIENTEKPLSLF